MNRSSAKRSDRIKQAQIIVQALWDLPEPPPENDIDVKHLAASGDSLDNRYKQALAQLRKES